MGHSNITIFQFSPLREVKSSWSRGGMEPIFLAGRAPRPGALVKGLSKAVGQVGHGGQVLSDGFLSAIVAGGFSEISHDGLPPFWVKNSGYLSFLSV